jgi:5-(carboxyamino)imidazole ribonucleotide synthase
VTTVGVLGAGQLARMLGMAALRLDCRLRVFDPAVGAPAAALAEHECSAWDDEAALARFCSGLDVATVEFENVPARSARFVASRTRFRPSLVALTTAQDRLAEKELARTLGVDTAPFARVDRASQLEWAMARIGSPSLLKSRRGGYDGRGQQLVRVPGDLLRAWWRLGGGPCILEGIVPFDREVSQIVVRGADGQMAFYPLVENQHRDGVLRRTIAPAPEVSRANSHAAREITRAIAEATDYVGVLAVELFEVGGRLLFNEIAPRVHNSGHWTIEGATTSQFENHLRAITGLPIGSTTALGWSMSRNILGRAPELSRILRVPGVSLHLYGKASAARRKLGHVTVRASSLEQLVEADAAIDEAFATACPPEAAARP